MVMLLVWCSSVAVCVVVMQQRVDMILVWSGFQVDCPRKRVAFDV
jgi:hypothetical protein